MKKEMLLALAILTFLVIPAAYAGKTELTTYYPAPYGEYKDLQASNKLKVPVKPVNGDTNAVIPGEIWVEGPCPTGAWNGSACA